MKHKTSGTRELGLNEKGQEGRKDKHLNNPDREGAKQRNECGLTHPHHRGGGGGKKQKTNKQTIKQKTI